MIRINDIVDKVSDYIPDADLDIIERAYIYSARVHEGQVRLSGEPYLSHPLEVAGILADMKLDPESVKSALIKTGGNKAKAAKLLGVGRATLYRFLGDYPELSGAVKLP